MLYTNLLGTKIVKRSYEEGKSGVDGNNPGKSTSVVEIRDEDNWVRDRLKGPAYCLPKGIAQVTRSPLLNSDQAEEPRTSGRLLCWMELAIVERLVKQYDDSDQTDTGFNCIDPERPSPR